MQKRELSETGQAAVRQKLMDRLHTARAEIKRAGQLLRSQADDSGEIDEPIGSGTEREMAIALQEILEVRIEELEEALDRLDEGTYGVCQECGLPIAWERLEAMPEARRCVRCQGTNEEEK